MERVVEAHAAMHRPARSIDQAYLLNAAIVFLTAFVIIGIVDRSACRRFKRSFFALHVFANVVITALTLAGACRALMNPTASSIIVDSEPSSAIFLCWIYAIHIYHPIFFSTGVMDWVHHTPLYILNTLMFSVPSCDAVQLQACILTGIPGGIDYVLQVIEGEGMLSRARYKDLCASINMWLRMPFGVLSAFITFIGLIHYWDFATAYQRTVFVLMSVHAYWNPPFFCRQAVEANMVDIFNRFGLTGGSVKLPKVRAMSGKDAKKSAD